MSEASAMRKLFDYSAPNTLRKNLPTLPKNPGLFCFGGACGAGGALCACAAGAAAACATRPAPLYVKVSVAFEP